MYTTIDIDIEPSDLSQQELLACVEYAQEQPWFKEQGFIRGREALLEDEAVRELLKEMFDYFFASKEPVPEVVRKFLWMAYGRTVY